MKRVAVLILCLVAYSVAGVFELSPADKKFLQLFHSYVELSVGGVSSVTDYKTKSSRIGSAPTALTSALARVPRLKRFSSSSCECVEILLFTLSVIFWTSSPAVISLAPIFQIFRKSLSLMTVLS